MSNRCFSLRQPDPLNHGLTERIWEGFSTSRAHDWENRRRSPSTPRSHWLRWDRLFPLLEANYRRNAYSQQICYVEQKSCRIGSGNVTLCFCLFRVWGVLIGLRQNGFPVACVLGVIYYYLFSWNGTDDAQCILKRTRDRQMWRLYP